MIRVATGDATLAAELGIAQHSNADMLLEQTDGKLQLRDTRGGAPGPLFIDFNSTEMRRRVAAGASLPVVRAVRGRSGDTPTVVDATAGLGRDAYVLAKAGMHVVAVEKSPIVAALLRDGLQRADVDMQVLIDDAVRVLTTTKADVVYLDPMFPERRKSALVKKEMQYFQALIGSDDVDSLFEAAIECAKKRVVIKRPAQASAVAKPTHTIPGKTVRFDVYVV